MRRSHFDQNRTSAAKADNTLITSSLRYEFKKKGHVYHTKTIILFVSYKSEVECIFYILPQGEYINWLRNYVKSTFEYVGWSPNALTPQAIAFSRWYIRFALWHFHNFYPRWSSIEENHDQWPSEFLFCISVGNFVQTTVGRPAWHEVRKSPPCRRKATATER